MEVVTAHLLDVSRWTEGDYLIEQTSQRHIEQLDVTLHLGAPWRCRGRGQLSLSGLNLDLHRKTFPEMRGVPIKDALAFNLERQLQLFLQAVLPSVDPLIAQLQSSSLPDALPLLSILLKKPKYTLLVLQNFRPILLDLCARWLDDEIDDEAKFSAFGFLSPCCEELYPYVSIPAINGTTRSQVMF